VSRAAAAACYVIAGLDMKVDWDFTAEAFLDQLPSQERAKVIHAVQRLSSTPDSSNEIQLKKLAGVQNDLYSLRVGGDLRILVRKRNDAITVVDVIRRSQVEGLRRLHKQGQCATE
jgi:mRNA-degrading endonuclease RelE of RelBE toxin-antitoxin system